MRTSDSELRSHGATCPRQTLGLSEGLPVRALCSLSIPCTPYPGVRVIEGVAVENLALVGKQFIPSDDGHGDDGHGLGSRTEP
jgi:hypothetical protein